MSTDWKALCQELLIDYEQHLYRSVLADRVRAALAESVAAPAEPTDEELLATLNKATAEFPPRHPEAEALNAVEYALELELRKARAAISRYGHQPAPPAEGEVQA